MIGMRDATLLHNVCVYAMFTRSQGALRLVARACGKPNLRAESIATKETGNKPF
jgi:hypothetical protein